MESKLNVRGRSTRAGRTLWKPEGGTARHRDSAKPEAGLFTAPLEHFRGPTMT